MSATDRAGRDAPAPDAEVRTYYGRPVIKPPVWTWEVPAYVFVGGTAGASSLLAAAAERHGDRRLARVARLIAGMGAAVSPPLLISDLGVPARFHHMLRVLKPTSPMSVGSWILALFAPAAVGAAVLDVTGRLPRTRDAAGTTAAMLGPAVTVYTAVLFSDTAVPVWHEARRELPALFAASGVASAGAAAVLGLPRSRAARTIAIGGAAAEVLVSEMMVRRLGGLAAPYRTGPTGWLQRAATTAASGGMTLLALRTRRRSRRLVGAGLVLLGAALQRWAVFRAGFASAADPVATIRPQRARLAAGAGGGAGQPNPAPGVP